jgi:hypothetical protein
MRFGHPAEREQDAEAERDPPERSPRRQERNEHSSRGRQVVAEQARVHGLGKQELLAIRGPRRCVP